MARRLLLLATLAARLSLLALQLVLLLAGGVGGLRRGSRRIRLPLLLLLLMVMILSGGRGSLTISSVYDGQFYQLAFLQFIFAVNLCAGHGKRSVVVAAAITSAGVRSVGRSVGR